MKFYRIARADRATTAFAAFSGYGAARYPGRWNHRGYRGVYCSDTLPGACLEMFVHIRPLPRRLPDSVFFHLEIDDAFLEEPELAALPPNWNAPAVPNETRDFGTAFLDSHRAVALVIPTVIIPCGLTALINPFHPDFENASISGPHPFYYDDRLE